MQKEMFLRCQNIKKGIFYAVLINSVILFMQIQRVRIIAVQGTLTPLAVERNHYPLPIWSLYHCDDIKFVNGRVRKRNAETNSFSVGAGRK